MTAPIPNCPQPETPIRERAWTDAQIEALRKDAERYRWLRNTGHPDHESGIAVSIEWTNSWGKSCASYPYGAELDAAIDDAINQGQSND
jgi:hypothetical protein